MKVMVIVKATRDSEAGVIPSEQLLTDMGKFNEELVKAGVMLAGEGLHPSSKGVRVHFSGSNRHVVDGPFAETKELIAGYWMWQVASMDEAVAWVKRCPNPMLEDSIIEIRPVFEMEDFGDAMTPELREQESSIHAQTIGLGEPRFLVSESMLITGYHGRFNNETRAQIPALWGRFAPHIGSVPGQQGDDAYGVCWNCDSEGGFDYLAGVRVSPESVHEQDSSASEANAMMHHVSLPRTRYVVFTHAEHISSLSETFGKIWRDWFPRSSFKATSAPVFERYTSQFNPVSGLGGVEIWIPIES